MIAVLISILGLVLGFVVLVFGFGFFLARIAAREHRQNRIYRRRSPK